MPAHAKEIGPIYIGTCSGGPWDGRFVKARCAVIELPRHQSPLEILSTVQPIGGTYSIHRYQFVAIESGSGWTRGMWSYMGVK